MTSQWLYVTAFICVCVCSYGEISGSNFGRVRVNSGTNTVRERESKRDRDEYRSERSRGWKWWKEEGGKDQEVPTGHSSCGFPPELRSEEISMLLNL